MRPYVFFLILFFPAFAFSQKTTPEPPRHVAEDRFTGTGHAPDIPTDRTLLEQCGDAYGRLRQWDKAAECYRELTLQYPGVADYHYKYGGVLGMIALENKVKAIGLVGHIKKAFKKAALLDAKHKAVRWALVELYMQLPGILGGSRQKALHYATELEQLSKAEGCLAKGYIYEYGNNDKDAALHYALALKNLHTLKNPSENRLRYKAGKLCGDHNTKLDEGIRYLEEYIRYHTPRDPVALHVVYCEIAKLYRLKNEKEKALSWIRKALDSGADPETTLKEKARIEML
ncbi:MAG: tetratricopeptide repeat protein [Sinomicrobium sp.]|nr:tetratricopeptide repeat protein [Sinomicrobium sp.]